MITLVTERDMILDVAERWKAQYYHSRGYQKDGRPIESEWSTTISGNSEDQYIALMRLDLSIATAEDVEAIVGDGGWLTIYCSACREAVNIYIQFNEEDEDDYNVWLCLDCVQEATDILKSVLSYETK